jgi:chorismate dehydratase
MLPWKLGAVSYLNARPLLAGFGEDLCLLPPSRLAGSLRAGEIDVALVPVVECLREPGYTMLDGWGIACRGDVSSVAVFSDVPWEQVGRVALDPESMTSNHLLQVLERRFWKRGWELVGPEEPAEARLLIGDRALKRRRAWPEERILDLGGAWLQATGLPFVFAVWGVRPGVPVPAGAADAFRVLCGQGVARRGDFGADEFERRYLTESIHYKLGQQEHEAVRRFAAELRGLELIPEHSFPAWA